jgi:hypothetical protein
LGAFGEINFEHTLDILRTIPVAAPTVGRSTMLSESIDTLESQYKQREAPILSGFTRSYGNPVKYSSSPRTSGLLDSRLRFTSAHSDCSTSSFDTDHGGPSTKRPYNMESDYFTSGFSNASTNGSSSSGSTMAKPMQKLKIIEVNPSKGKHKKQRSSSTATSNLSNADSNSKINNHTFINSNNSTGTKIRTGGQLNIASDDDRRGILPSSPLSAPTNHKKSREVSAETGTTSTKTSKAPAGTSQSFIIDNNINSHSNCTDSNTLSLVPTTGSGIVHDQQQHHLYQASNHQYQQQHFNDGMHAYRDSSSSSTSPHQSFTPSAGTQGMEYGMNTLFTLGDGLTGDHQSSLLYEQFFASANNGSNPDSNHISTSMHTTTASTTTPVPISYDGSALGSNHPGLPMSVDPLLAPSLSPSSSISSSLQFPYYYSSEQASTAPSSVYIPPSYLPSR